MIKLLMHGLVKPILLLNFCTQTSLLIPGRFQMKVLLIGLLLISSVAIPAETIGPYMCTKDETGKLIAGPYSCSVDSNGATIASVRVPVDAKVSALNSTIYRFVQNLTATSAGKGVMIAAGSVPPGTSCDLTQKLTFSGIEYFRIDRTTLGLVWSGNNRPPTVWAQCS